MNIFGIPIDNLSHAAVLRQIGEWLESDRFHRIATVNPEFLLLAERNQAFRGALHSADLRLVDGVGLHLPFFLGGEPLIGHYPGADVLKDILELADAKRLSVGLLLAPSGLSTYADVERATHSRHPNIDIQKFAPEYLSSSLQPIPYAIVFCNYGAPLQEIILAGLRENPGNVRLAMGVGGAFDFLTGKVPRAPKLLRSIGLEWAWRLYQQPRRVRRIWNAVVVFPLKVLSQK